MAVGVSNEVVRVDLNAQKVTGRLAVGREPRGIALSPDESRLLVSNARSQSVSVIDPRQRGRSSQTIPIDGDNLRQVAISADGKTGYIANMRNRRFATTKNNIDLGWVLGQRLTRVPLDGTVVVSPRSRSTRRARRLAMRTASRSAGTTKFVAVSCGGTHEVMIFRTDLKRLPWRPNSSRDLIAPELLKKDGRFRRVHARRPADRAGLRPRRQDPLRGQLPRRRDPGRRRGVGRSWSERSRWAVPRPCRWPAGARSCSTTPRYSFNQWYSCNTCHSDGHTNGLDFDTLNDGRQDLSTFHQRSRKKVPTLRRVTKTKPWTWHGWQTSLDDAMVESFTKSMQGPKPKSEDVKALVAFLDTLDYPKNPFRRARRRPHSGRQARPGRLPIRQGRLQLPATAAPSSPTARSTRPGSKSPTMPTAATIPLRSAASTTRTPTSTTAAPRPSATP